MRRENERGSANAVREWKGACGERVKGVERMRRESGRGASECERENRRGREMRRECRSESDCGKRIGERM